MAEFIVFFARVRCARGGRQVFDPGCQLSDLLHFFGTADGAAAGAAGGGGGAGPGPPAAVPPPAARRAVQEGRAGSLAAL